MILYLIGSVVVALVTFLIGGWLSSGFLTSEVTAAWTIVCAIAGAVGCLNLLEHRK